MTEENVKMVLIYYISFWALNSLAYGLVSMGMYRWTKFTHGLDAGRALHTTMIVTGAFGLARFIVGGIGITMYMNDITSPFTTIVAMGMTSLFLNTAFIMGEGLFLNREAKLLFNAPEDNKPLMREAMRRFEELRRTVSNA